MSAVLQLARQLTARPEITPIPGVSVRNYADSSDIPIWLDLRHRAFARQKVGIRQWTEADFHAEFTARPDWSPDHIWFAETAGFLGKTQVLGTVALTLRRGADEIRPAVHWLAVLPRHRRRGIGDLLLTTLEQYCWDQGFRGVWLETHSAWSAACALYESRGYVPASVESGETEPQA